MGQNYDRGGAVRRIPDAVTALAAGTDGKLTLLLGDDQ
jgi:hypothetical protein